jgi:hypothetical protein
MTLSKLANAPVERYAPFQHSQGKASMTRLGSIAALLGTITLSACSTERNASLALDRLDRAPGAFYTADRLTRQDFLEGESAGPVFCPVVDGTFALQCPATGLEVEKIAIDPGQLAPTARPIVNIGPAGDVFGIRAFKTYTPGRYAMAGSTVVASGTTTLTYGGTGTTSLTYGFRPVTARTVVFDAQPGAMVVIDATSINRRDGMVPAATQDAVEKVRATLGGDGGFNLVVPQEVTVNCSDGSCRIVDVIR